MKIAVIGTQNIGKSTFIDDFLMKWPMYKRPDKTYRDYVKEENLPTSKEGTEESQKIILNALIDQSLGYDKSDNVIFDRCAIDNLAYSSWLNLNGKLSDDFLDTSVTIARESLKMYDIIFFLPLTKYSNIPIEENGTRDIDEVYRQEIDAIFKAFQQSYHKGDGKVFPKDDCPPMIEIFGNRQERIMLASLYVSETGGFYGEDSSLVSDLYLPPEKEIIVP